MKSEINEKRGRTIMMIAIILFVLIIIAYALWIAAFMATLTVDSLSS